MKVVVKKWRHLFVWEQRVRIHLDKVDSLGDFLEFEAMLSPDFFDYVRRGYELDQEIHLVTNFFNDYKKDFMAHITQEEEHILPYVLELERQSALEKPDPGFIQKLQSYSISEFEKEHDRLEISLKHLSELIIKYLPPFDDLHLCHEVLNELAGLMKDLVDHADVEDKVLIPRVAELESSLLNSTNSV